MGGKGEGERGHPLPAGAAQRLLQPPQRGAGVGPGMRHGGSGGAEGTARGRLVARASAQCLPHRCPDQPRAQPGPAALSASRRRRRSESPARRHCAGAAAARAARPQRFPRSGSGAGPPVRAGLGETPSGDSTNTKSVLMASPATRWVGIFSNYRENRLLTSSGATRSGRMA